MAGSPQQIKKRIQTIRDKLCSGLIEREEPVRLALLSALAGEHLLLIGEPGTAKSVLARKLHQAFREGEYFERLLTKFSVPDELFGPLSIKALESDRYQRLTKRYLPTASIAFIDEIFKANSAILNALLTLLNEREFDNGDERVKTPLISVIAASNELPEDDGLDALYDRFLCRYKVEPVSADNFLGLLQLTDASETITQAQAFTPEQVEKIQWAAEKVDLSEECLQLLGALRSYLQEQKIYVSDRRWRKAVKLLKVCAYTNGQKQVSVWDGCLLKHCLWHEPEQKQLIADWYRSHIGISGQLNLHTLEKLVFTWEQVLEQDRNTQIQQKDEQQRLLYIDQQGELTRKECTRLKPTRDGQPLYFAPSSQQDRSGGGDGYSGEELREQFFDDVYQQTHIEGRWVHFDQYVQDAENRFVEDVRNSPAMQPKQHSAAFIEGRLKETGHLSEDIATLQKALGDQLDSLDKTIGEHIWMMPEFAEQAGASLKLAKDQATNLFKRVQKVTDDYRNLPRLS